MFGQVHFSKIKESQNKNQKSKYSGRVRNCIRGLEIKLKIPLFGKIHHQNRQSIVENMSQNRIKKRSREMVHVAKKSPQKSLGKNP
jgi:hypothetical protein